ncbi:hypothetical protein [Nannocystis bainbridge]|uniref:Uncharacterized protein n=1 Tax=Nannocystis bainbridge TaxID=2995303 RepID=A0ABT5E5F3_9BACT|nr:hypothetical protein [Nannocystis bainbridge]MDC0721071.1 hypothetical protein [Nannocystis bainbridge]
MSIVLLHQRGIEACFVQGEEKMRNLFFVLSAFFIACDSPDDEELFEVSEGEMAQDADADAVGPDELSANPRPAAANCHYKVLWPTAGVYEKPGWNLLKTKNAGDIVGDWCDWTYYDGSHEYLAVTTASAEDGIGWMRRSAVVKM